MKMFFQESRKNNSRFLIGELLEHRCVTRYTTKANITSKIFVERCKYCEQYKRTNVNYLK